MTSAVGTTSVGSSTAAAVETIATAAMRPFRLRTGPDGSGRAAIGPRPVDRSDRGRTAPPASRTITPVSAATVIVTPR